MKSCLATALMMSLTIGAAQIYAAQTGHAAPMAPPEQAPSGPAANASPSPPPPSLPQLRKSFSDDGSDQFSWVLSLLDGLKSCRGERVASDRIKCYDALADKASAPGSQAAAATPKTGNWSMEKSVTGIIAAGVPAVFVEDDGAEKTRVSLFFRCRQENQVDIYLMFSRKISQSGAPVDVSVKFDSIDGGTMPWEPSSSGAAVGLWGTERSISLIRRVARQRHLSVRLAMPDDKSVFASFDLLGIENALAPIQQSCKLAM